MKKILAILLSCAMLLTGCATAGNKSSYTPANTTVFETVTQTSTAETTAITDVSEPDTQLDTADFSDLDDPELLQYIEDSVYSDLVAQLDSDEYFVENVSAIYISKEYLDELAYNSQENIYFGYTLSELEEQFEDKKFIFTLGDDGKTEVREFEEYDDTYDKVIRNVAIGTGVILLCVTVSLVTAETATAVSVIFAASAKGGTALALSDGVFSGVTAGIVTGIQTNNLDTALKSAALEGSNGFMWGAIGGCLTGGTAKYIDLKGATLSGLTLNQAAKIQKESGYPTEIIKMIKSMDEYEIYKEAGLTAQKINGKTYLLREIDLDFVDENGLSNIERMLEGKSAIDPETGLAYECHHIGQKDDSPIAILKKEEHRQNGNDIILHTKDKASEINRPKFNKDRKNIWKDCGGFLMGEAA